MPFEPKCRLAVLSSRGAIMLVCAVAFACAAPLLVPATASAVPLRDYIHTTWMQHDGVPLGRVKHILQTRDGYLWVITRDAGLLRFDGMRFVAVPTPCKQLVTHAASTPDGGFWAICGDQLIRRTADGGVIEIPQTFLRSQPPLVAGLLVDALGRPWFVRESVRYLEPDGTGGREMPRPTAGFVRTAAIDTDGTLWASDSEQVAHVGRDRTEIVPLGPVWCLVGARDGGVFALTPHRVWRLRPGVSPVPIRGVAGVRLIGAPACMAQTGDGSLWLGTRSHGMALLGHERLEIRSDAGPFERSIESVFIDREGSVWAGATTGLHRFRTTLVQSLPGAFDRLGAAPAFVFVDSRDRVWVSPAHDDGVARLDLRDSKWGGVGPSRHVFWGVGEDEHGRVWLSNTYDIGYVDEGKFVAVRDAANRPIREVSAFRRDGRGHLWALATRTGLYRVTPGPPRLVIASPRVHQDFLISDRFGTWIAQTDGSIEQHVNGTVTTFAGDHAGTGTNMIRTIVEDADSIWVGRRYTLSRWRHGTWTTWTPDHGLPDGGAEEILPDRFGRVWMMTPLGLLMLSRTQLNATPDGNPRRLEFARIGALDGVVPHSGGMAPSPRAGADRSGRMYFATLDSVVTLDPAGLTESALAPPIALDSVAIDDRPVDPATMTRFVQPSRLQFDYTSLNLRSPENARFRYRLEGYDADWIDAGTHRRVTYGTLRPGSYRFRVIGAGSEGVWNEEGASFAFSVVPVFWRTWWFQLAALTSVLAAVLGLYRLRVRQLTRQFNLGLDARVSERTRVARELHDTFLQTIHGSRMVAEHALTNAGDHAGIVVAMEKLSVWLERATAEGRAALNALRASTTERNDLADAFRRALEEGRGDGRAQPSLSVTGRPRQMHPIVRDEIYWVGHEAIRNALSHSHGDRLEVTLDYGHDLLLRVSDNGVGIDGQIGAHGKDGHFGLRGMRERAERIRGKLTVTASPGSGTIVTLTVPGRLAYGRDALEQQR